MSEYNLLKTSDLNYFEGKKYPHVVVKTLERITEIPEAAYYLLLIGTSARLLDIKTFYIK